LFNKTTKAKMISCYSKIWKPIGFNASFIVVLNSLNDFGNVREGSRSNWSSNRYHILTTSLTN